MPQAILRIGARLAAVLLFLAVPVFGQSTAPVLVKDLVFGSSDSNPTALMKSDTTLFFSTWNAGRYYRSDGTDAGTSVISEVSFADSTWTYFNNQVYFAGHDGFGWELWRVNAAGDGTELVLDISTSPEGSQPRQLKPALGRIFFSAFDDSGGRELWTTDGTAAGTILVRDLRYNGSSDPRHFTEYNGWVYFVADDDNGFARLWRTDGTEAGTSQYFFTTIGKPAYDDPLLIAHGGFLYFSATTSFGTELWKTDGTVISPVADLQPGGGSSFPHQAVAVGNRLYFAAITTALGDELYMIPAPGESPVLVADINPGPAGSFPFANTTLGDSLLLSAGGRLWKADGTTLTELLDTQAVESARIGRFVYFTVASPRPGTGHELWVTDGTAAGTHIVSDLIPGTASSYPSNLTPLGDRLFFTATTPFTGKELWRVDTCDATITPAGPTTFCHPGNVMLTASPGTSYLWSTGQTTQSMFAVSSGSYTVTVTTANGCTVTSPPIVVTANSPEATVTPSGPTTFCEGGSVTLTASAASSYLWSTGATTQSIAVTESGNYWVTVTDANGCSRDSAPMTLVTVNPLPTATITPSGPTTFCEGGSVTLTASAASSYLWSTGATTQAITVNASGSYSVTVTDANSCSATSAPTSVTVNPLPSATITPAGPTTFCEGGSVTLTASAASSYLWSTGATTQAIAVSASGSYSVTVTDANSCSATSAPTTVTVNANPPAPVITPSGPTTFCQGGSVTLTAPAGYTYLWSTGAATQAISVSASGSYSVTVTNAKGCSAASAATSVTVTPAGAIGQHPQSVTIPKNTSTTLSVIATGTGTLTYQWYRGVSGTTSNPIAGETSSTYNTGRLTKGTYTYWVRVTSACGPVNSNTATVTAQ